jgi:hypothetical protein
MGGHRNVIYPRVYVRDMIAVAPSIAFAQQGQQGQQGSPLFQSVMVDSKGKTVGAFIFDPNNTTPGGQAPAGRVTAAVLLTHNHSDTVVGHLPPPMRNFLDFVDRHR